jgi:hypothetical protein
MYSALSREKTSLFLKLRFFFSRVLISGPSPGVKKYSPEAVLVKNRKRSRKAFVHYV